MTTLIEFYDMLEQHDWYYAFSDDHRVWKAGNANLAKIQNIVRESAEHAALYSGFHNHYFSGPAWSTEQSPKPERPE